MRHFGIFSLILLTTILSACQVFNRQSTTDNTTQKSIRLQGHLTQDEHERWIFHPCNQETGSILQPSHELSKEIEDLASEAPHGLFADLSGHYNEKNHFTPTQRYRLQTEGFDCNDPDFTRLLVRASGNEPFWSLLQTPKGLIFHLPNQSALALPYMEEKLPDGRYHLSTEANDLLLRLWLTPQSCTDNMSGTVHHLTARLQWNENIHYGCASFGGLRQ